MPLYLVTGGCGFIGSHLSAALRARGDGVRVLDDLSTGSLANLAPGAELVRGDVADHAAVRDAIAGVDGIFHLAAIASVERGVQDWPGTHRANLSGTIAMLDAARLRKLPFVYASSAAVYGDQAVLPITEDAPKRPLSAYGADKLGCEQHALVGGLVHGIPSMGFRFFNVFGPRQDPRSPYSGVISIFCDRFSRGEGVDIFGDGGQTRDFVHVSDVVAALLAGMAQASVEAPVLNVCTGRATSVRELAETIAAACGVPAEIRQRPPRAGEIRHSLGDATRLRALLGPGAPRGLRAGLEEVVAWLRVGRPGLVPGSTIR
ncbi:NAD-dependent epimerase/dehydratase family protein [Paracraurococcus ruber]|uniref:Epimerase n=1 Tax=Paracraurococcus ruber TaxID=77675 RepID=A0ABS1CUX9_9PROT|nr:NAD-dependent epimerase/dehydratase family protein [Paracraurococcus ruber]MBK1658287.1 epimerase [Paracraurococcus ruber]TDG31008.1 NAD-dependent epimerase/dehydratase family protein [Paracraurococcus ruber]